MLEGCAVQHPDSDGHFAFSLVFGPGLKTYRFAARDRQTQESWVKALQSASYCYISLLVKDLRRQYEGVLGGLWPIQQSLFILGGGGNFNLANLASTCSTYCAVKINVKGELKCID